VEALERLGFTGFVSNKSILPFVFGAAARIRTGDLILTNYCGDKMERYNPKHACIFNALYFLIFLQFIPVVSKLLANTFKSPPQRQVFFLHFVSALSPEAYRLASLRSLILLPVIPGPMCTLSNRIIVFHLQSTAKC